jgi:hypothetical protein
MMGSVKGTAVDPAQFSPFRPAKVLYDLDGPRSFTFVPADGHMYLAHWFDESEQLVRYIVVPFSPALLGRLESGQCSIREALDQNSLWIVDIDNQGKPVSATRTTLADLPADELPVPGTPLSPSMEAAGRNGPPTSTERKATPPAPSRS